METNLLVSILILLDYLFLCSKFFNEIKGSQRLNPYFIGLSILILQNEMTIPISEECLNPYFIGLSILIDFLMSQ